MDIWQAAVWGASEKVPFLALPISIVRQETHASAPPPGSPGPFRLADENQLRNPFDKAGFKDVYTDRLNAVFEFNSAEDFTRYQQAIAAPVIAMLANETKPRHRLMLSTQIDEMASFVDRYLFMRWLSMYPGLLYSSNRR